MAPIKDIKDFEEFSLKILKVAVLLIMGLALIAILFFVATAAYQYSQTPKEPAPAQKAPEKSINLEDLKTYLIEQEKRNKGGEAAPKQQPGEHQDSLRFIQDTISLVQCSDKFRIAIGAAVSSDSDEDLKILRPQIERTATGSPQRGEPWVKDVVAFTCKVLSDGSIIALKIDEKIGSVFEPTLRFHLSAWDNIQAEKLQFERNEELRVTAERAAEAMRVSMARASAISLLIAAGGAFALLMVLAIYILCTRIENNLRVINGSILVSGRQEAD